MKITTVGVCIICGIFPLLILPQLPGTVTLAFLTLFACVLAFIPVKTVRYIALTLLFFVWGKISNGKIPQIMHTPTVVIFMHPPCL
ncbi:hypothetical protein AWE95_18290 [Escherichia coli]|nr:hypothetical protein AWE95_18290 [Escherichia coli]